MIFLSCDDIAQKLLSQAQKAGKINLAGEHCDDDRSRLIESIISVIARDSPTEKVRQELDLLTDVHNCVRERNEQRKDFVNRFQGAVARYFNYTASISDSTSRQFAVILSRNSHLTADTANAVNLQLAMLSQSRDKDEQFARIEMSKSMVSKLLNTPWLANDEETTCHEELSEETRRMIRSALKKERGSSDTDPIMFTLQEAVDARAQFKLNIAKDTLPQTSLLGKRFDSPAGPSEIPRNKRKLHTKYHACGKIGHWLQDREECRRYIDEKRLAKRNMKAEGDAQ